MFEIILSLTCFPSGSLLKLRRFKPKTILSLTLLCVSSVSNYSNGDIYIEYNATIPIMVSGYRK